MQTVTIRILWLAIAVAAVGCHSTRQATSTRPMRSGALGNGKSQEQRPAGGAAQAVDKQLASPAKVSESSGAPVAEGYKTKTAYGRERNVNKVIETAKSYLSTPYQFGGSTRSGIDCSALMMLSFQAGGVQLPRTADAQALKGKPLKINQLQPGDLLFFDTMKKGRVGHSALVVANTGGQVRFIHASVSGGVRIDNLDNSYWQKYYLMAKRVLP